MAAYPELRSGRFAVIADFEDPKHMEIFRLIGVSPKARAVLHNTRGRFETGRKCLEFVAGSESDAVVISNELAANWYLKRDWRAYDLLLMSVESPRDGLTADVLLAAGTPDEMLEIHSFEPLRRGWNTIRLDLAEVGERIPLDDVREVRVSVSGVRKPARMYIDDIILTGSRENLLGDPQGQTGELFVERAGRRWNVGAGGRFGLTFANGQIVGWHNLAADPYRVRNLLQGTTLGPTPVVVESAEGGEGDFSALGSKVLARSQIIEMSPVRVVVASEWRFVDDPNVPPGDRPLHRWVYTIYPTGQMYGTVECTTQTGTWSAPTLGAAVAMAASPEAEFQPRVSQATQSPNTSDELPSFASARSEQGDAFLLYVPGEPERLMQLMHEFEAQRRRVSFVAVNQSRDAPTESWIWHVLLASAGRIADEEALARAVDYTHPAELQFELGSPVPFEGGSTGATGFDPTTGCYVCMPDQGRVRFVIDGQVRPRFSPAFRIVADTDENAWVYVNHLVLDKVVRDSAGDLIFQLPGTVRSETIVEVLFRRQSQPDDA